MEGMEEFGYRNVYMDTDGWGMDGMDETNERMIFEKIVPLPSLPPSIP